MRQGKKTKLARAGWIRPGETPEEFSTQMAESKVIEATLKAGLYLSEEAKAALKRLHQLKSRLSGRRCPIMVHNPLTCDSNPLLNARQSFI